MNNTFATAAESYVGVPFRLHGKNRHGVDCVGLLVAAAEESGYSHPAAQSAIAGYKLIPSRRTVLDGIDNFLVEKPYNRLQPLREQAERGDILLFNVDSIDWPRHFGIYCGVDEMLDYMVHADARLRRVIRTHVDGGRWIPRLHSLWQLPN